MFWKLLSKKQPKIRTVHIPAHGVTFEVAPKQTVLEAALANGVPFPHQCRVGGCATCKCRLVSGNVRERTDPSYLLSDDELDNGTILACQSEPKGDLVIEVDGLRVGGPAHPTVRTQGRITRLQRVGGSIVVVDIALDQPMAYTAGQYVDITMPGVAAPRSYSMSTPSADGRMLRLHIKHVPGGEASTWIHSRAAAGDALELHGPFGDMWLRPSGKPIVGVAGGSGLAPILAMLREARAEGATRDVVLLYGARTQADLYADDAIRRLQRDWLAHFAYVPVLSHEPPDSEWQGARGWVHSHLGANLPDDAAVLLCGPPPMVDAAEAEAMSAGIDEKQIWADRFLDAATGAARDAATRRT